MLDKTGTLPANAADAAQDSYRHDIDGLRAVAVLAVVFFHAFPTGFPGGFVGVDIFFVISGYLISGHIFQSLSAGRFSLLDFYSRRVRRIFPALITVLLACLAFGWFGLLANEFMFLGKHIAASAAFVANLVFWSEAGYFDDSAIAKPLLHLWSLGVEEQFYIAWPLLAWAAWRWRIGALGLMLAVAFISMTINLMTVHFDPTAAFYSPLSRVWELLIGAGLAEIERRRSTSLSQSSLAAASVMGAFLIGISLWQIRESDAFPGLVAVFPTVGAALLIAAGPNAPINRYVLALRPAVLIGLISYPLYLWHWPLLSFTRIVESATPDRPVRIGLILLTFVLAALTYRFIERPVRSERAKKSSKLVIALCVVMGLVGGLGADAYMSGGNPLRPAAQSAIKVSSQYVGSMWAFTKNENCLRRFKMPGVEDYGWWFCMLEKDELPTILVIGGSFANQLYPGLAHNKRLADQNVLSIGTCAQTHTETGSLNGELNINPCSGTRRADQNAFIDKILNDTPSIHTVIVDGLSDSSNAEYVNGVSQRLKELDRDGVQIVVFAPHYKRDFDIRGCFSRPFASPKFVCDIPPAEYTNLTKANTLLEQQLASRVPGILFFEQNQAFCKEGQCSLIADGYPLIRDGYYHISEHASELVGDAFVKWAETNYPAILSPKD